jgi:hypothetical protein
VTAARVFAIATLVATLLAIALACGSNPVTIATIVADAGHTTKCEVLDGSDGRGTCDAGFCSRLSCGSTEGQCEAIGSPGCEASGYECGCDGITYYNSCVRQQAQVSRATPGQCGPGMHVIGCQLRDGCKPAHAGCGILAPITLNLPTGLPLDMDAGSAFEQTCQNMPPFSGAQICWALPDTCPSSGAPLVQEPCPGAACVPDCIALGSGVGGLYFQCAPDASAH